MLDHQYVLFIELKNKFYLNGLISLNITPFSITILSITILSIATLSIAILSTTTLSIVIN